MNGNSWAYVEALLKTYAHWNLELLKLITHGQAVMDRDQCGWIAFRFGGHIDRLRGWGKATDKEDEPTVGEPTALTTGEVANQEGEPPLGQVA